MTDTVTVTIRMPKALRDAILATAKEEDRSFNKTVVRMLTTMLHLTEIPTHSQRLPAKRRAKKTVSVRK